MNDERKGTHEQSAFFTRNSRRENMKFLLFLYSSYNIQVCLEICPLVLRQAKKQKVIS
jgi:hypothetical protein